MISQGVTSCAGMTAQHVLLAQTKTAYVGHHTCIHMRVHKVDRNWQLDLPGRRSPAYHNSFSLENHVVATCEETKFPVWKKMFAHILRTCGYLENYDTIYVLVDTRNLADHQTGGPGLPHWPAAVAWWKSRLQMTGPMGERSSVFFPATEATGLANVHPTWTGTFVLAALEASFPRKHFLLVDSNCLPVTLYEAFDLWQEVFLTRFL